MASGKSEFNLLLEITLEKTDDPCVSRLLSVPGDLLFKELHETIAAAFGWADPAEPCHSWKFTLHDAADSELRRLIYYTDPSKGFGIYPHKANTGEILNDMLYFDEVWGYHYGIFPNKHKMTVKELELLGTGKISCIGGQGNIEHNAWQFEDHCSFRDVISVERSNWECDMVEVSRRVNVVQVAYERRKGGNDEPPNRRTKLGMRN